MISYPQKQAQNPLADQFYVNYKSQILSALTGRQRKWRKEALTPKSPEATILLTTVLAFSTELTQEATSFTKKH